MRLFDSAAEEYDNARPSYPAAVYDLVGACCGGLAGKAVVDGGTGTGIVARQLAERGAEVVAFDPGVAMLLRAVARAPQLRAMVGEAAAVPLRSGVVDLVCFGQSWHWVDQAMGTREVARILKPGGWWAAWWNHPWADSEAWFDQYCHLLEDRCPGFSPRQRNIDWCAKAIASHGAFDPPQRHIVPWDRTVTVSDWITDLRSHSYVIALGESDQARLLADAKSILNGGFPGGTMNIPYETRVWIARLDRPQPQKDPVSAR